MTTTTLDLGSAPPVRSAWRSNDSVRDLSVFIPLAGAAAVCLLVILSIAFTRTTGVVASVWGAGAVAAIAWWNARRGIAHDFSMAAMLFVAFGTGNLMAGNPPPLSLLFAVANLAEVVACVLLTRRFVPGLDVSTTLGLGRFWLFGCALPPILPWFATALALQSMGHGDFLGQFQTLWFGHALGFAVLGPVALSLRHARPSSVRPLRWIEGTALIAGLTAVTVAVFGQPRPICFAIIPGLVLLSTRLRLIGASIGLALVAGVAIVMTAKGFGPFSPDQTPEGVEIAQLFVLIGCLPTLLIATALSERDVHARELTEARVRAEAASEGKSRLLANVSHEIKSPVAGIIGIGELWAGGQLGPVTPMQTEMAGVLMSTARQVEALAHDLLDVSRAESGAVSVDLSPVDAQGVVEDVARAVALRPEARELRFNVTPAPERLVVQADSVRLAQVLTNLAVNAVKYGRAGGVVDFAVTAPGPGTIRISVSDKGAGIGPEKKAQLFEPFNRLGMEKSSIEGHGIGLALAKRLVELQDGRIGVDSVPGHGATFWVELPRAA